MSYVNGFVPRTQGFGNDLPPGFFTRDVMPRQQQSLWPRSVRVSSNPARRVKSDPAANRTDTSHTPSVTRWYGKYERSKTYIRPCAHRSNPRQQRKSRRLRKRSK